MFLHQIFRFVGPYEIYQLSFGGAQEKSLDIIAVVKACNGLKFEGEDDFVGDGVEEEQMVFSWKYDDFQPPIVEQRIDRDVAGLQLLHILVNVVSWVEHDNFLVAVAAVIEIQLFCFEVAAKIVRLVLQILDADPKRERERLLSWTTVEVINMH